MKKLSLTIVLGLLGLLSLSASAAEELPACPTVEEIQSTQFDLVNQRIKHDGYTALPGDVYSFGDTQWVVILTGLHSSSVINANKQIKQIDVRQNEQAKPEYVASIPTLACQYSSTQTDLRVVAIPLYSTIDIL